MVDKSKSTDSQLADSNTELVQGVVFSDSRYSNSSDKEKLEIVLVDDKTVVLEDQNGDRRFDDRTQFEENIGNRWKVEKPAADIDTEDKKERRVDILKRGIKNRKKSYANDPDEPAKAIRKSTLNDILSNINVTDVFKQTNLEDISGVGEKTAENIRNAGIKTNLDVLCTSVHQLRKINGVGEETAKRMKKQANEEEKDKQFRSDHLQ